MPLKPIRWSIACKSCGFTQSFGTQRGVRNFLAAHEDCHRTPSTDEESRP